MVCPTVNYSWQSLKASSLNQLPGGQDPEWSGIGVLQPSRPDSQSLPFNESLGNEMEAEAQEGVSFLIWLLQKRNRFLSFSKSDHTGKVQAPRKERSQLSKSIFSKLLPAGSMKELRQKNFHGKRNIKEKGCVGGAIFQGHTVRTHRPDTTCPHLLPHCHHQARRPREKEGKQSTAKDLC